MLAIRTILHPTDLSAGSAAAFRLACSLARDYGARLVVVTAYPPPLTGAEVVDRTRPDGIADDLLARGARSRGGTGPGLVHPAPDPGGVRCLIPPRRGHRGVIARQRTPGPAGPSRANPSGGRR